VRSQADEGWIDPDNVPASVVAAPSAVTAPDLWEPVTQGVDLVVEQGVVLVHKATADPTDVRDVSTAVLSPASTSAAPGLASTSVGAPVVAHVPADGQRARHRHGSTRHHRTMGGHLWGGGRTTAADAHVVASTVPERIGSSAPATHGRGRHVGWSRAQGPEAGHDHGRHLGRLEHGS
jgi:hypothetical protein